MGAPRNMLSPRRVQRRRARRSRIVGDARSRSSRILRRRRQRHVIRAHSRITAVRVLSRDAGGTDPARTRRVRRVDHLGRADRAAGIGQVLARLGARRRTGRTRHHQCGRASTRECGRWWRKRRKGRLFVVIRIVCERVRNHVNLIATSWESRRRNCSDSQ